MIFTEQGKVVTISLTSTQLGLVTAWTLILKQYRRFAPFFANSNIAPPRTPRIML